nr:ECF RNA polymerase sigma factor SigF [uncultured bacterium]
MGRATETEERLRTAMLAALAGDSVAYRNLLRELTTMLQGYFRRRLSAGSATAEDLVQDTLMAIHTRRMTYDRQLPFTAWVHAIARYKLIDHFRRQRIRATVPLEDDDALLAVEEEAGIAARLDVGTVLAEVSPRQRELIRQVRIEGASIAEAAAATGMSETAAKVSIHRGLKAITAKFSGRKP